MTDVFISYKRENLAAVGRLVEALRAEGIGVWWDHIQRLAPDHGQVPYPSNRDHIGFEREHLTVR